MRDVDPFDYWENHSSAISGMGGRERSPDPRYCFHTRYHAVRPGRAQYVLRLKGMRASFGELSVRVHAWKPHGDSDVSLVSGGRILLQSKDEAEVTLPVHFVSQKDVLYAFYGYFSEDTDVAARALQVAIDEPQETGEVCPEPPRSILALDREVEETRPANALLHYGRTGIDHPVSQSCTLEQVVALGFPATGFGAHKTMAQIDLGIVRWRETVCINALNTYGAMHSGFEGLVVGPVSVDFMQSLAGTTVTTSPQHGTPWLTSSEFYDFLLMPAGLEAVMDAPSGVRERWETIERSVARLKIGGLAMLGLRYRPEDNVTRSSPIADSQGLSRNEIGQWSLRLIGSGYSVAPMAFAPRSDLAIDSRGLATFVMIIQRL